MRRAAVSTLIAALLLLSGCATDNRSDALSHILIQYANTVRWDGFEAAQQFIDPKFAKPIRCHRWTGSAISRSALANTTTATAPFR